MFVGDFGRAEDGRDIAREITSRMGPSLAIALPTFVLGLFVTVSLALLLAFFRASALDFWGVVLCVALMSISGLFYIIGGQYLISKLWRLVPISGYAGAGSALDAWKFVILPVAIGVVSGIGSSARWYRTIFLEEIGKDYVRTARAKGLSELTVLFRHVLRNAMIPILTGVVVVIPLLFMGSLADRIVLRHSGARQLHDRRDRRAGFRGGAGDGLHRLGALHRRADPHRHFLHAGSIRGSGFE